MKGLLLEELKYLYLNNNDDIKIYQNGRLIYSGFAFLFPSRLGDRTLLSLINQIEIRRKGWEKAKWEPEDNEGAARVTLADAEISLFWKIVIS